jgi:hypothetical protein
LVYTLAVLGLLLLSSEAVLPSLSAETPLFINSKDKSIVVRYDALMLLIS